MFSSIVRPAMRDGIGFLRKESFKNKKPRYCYGAGLTLSNLVTPRRRKWCCNLNQFFFFYLHSFYAKFVLVPKAFVLQFPLGCGLLQCSLLVRDSLFSLRSSWWGRGAHWCVNWMLCLKFDNALWMFSSPGDVQWLKNQHPPLCFQSRTTLWSSLTAPTNPTIVPLE